MPAHFRSKRKTSASLNGCFKSVTVKTAENLCRPRAKNKLRLALLGFVDRVHQVFRCRAQCVSRNGEP